MTISNILHTNDSITSLADVDNILKNLTNLLGLTTDKPHMPTPLTEYFDNYIDDFYADPYTYLIDHIPAPVSTTLTETDFYSIADNSFVELTITPSVILSSIAHELSDFYNNPNIDH